MADTVATPDFLARLKALYPSAPSYVDSAWYAVAAIAFSAGNCPDAVPLVLAYILDDLAAIGVPHADRLAAARKLRDAVFKSGMICGFPKVINALIALHAATPPYLQDTETLRNPDPTIPEIAHAGRAYFDQTYGDTARSTQSLVTAAYPDLWYYVINMAYGYGYAFMGATSPKETSFAMISALIATDVPAQIKWHLSGALRNGATVEEVKAVREIAIQVSDAVGVVRTHPVPDLE